MNGCTDALIAAVRREIEARRRHLDDADDVCEVTLTVRLQAGTTQVRSVRYQEERVFRANRKVV